MESPSWYWKAREAPTEKEVLREIDRALAAGADPNGLDADDWGNPLYWSTFGGLEAIVERLLAAGASPDTERRGCESSLHVAVEMGHPRILEVLLGAPCAKAIDSFDYLSRTPLMVAAELNDLESARRLISAGADVNAHCDEKAGDTAIRVAAEFGHLEMLRLLLLSGADPTIPGWMQLTAIHKAQLRSDAVGSEMLALMRESRGFSDQEWLAQLLRNRAP